MTLTFLLVTNYSMYMTTSRGFVGPAALVAGGIALLALLGFGAYEMRGTAGGNGAHNGWSRDQGTNAQEGGSQGADFVPTGTDLEQFPVQDLTEAERSGLLQMREEEKLARDVYQALYEKWGQQIFTNIASSEQQHTDAVKAVLDRHGIADPVTDDTPGVFSNPAFTGLYNTLVAQGSTSITAAYTVGATIEDLDINDLQDLLATTQAPDVAYVYTNLMRGSRNHLRSFTRQLSQDGGEYTAQYLSQSEVDEIISTSQETGNGANGGGGGQMQQGSRNQAPAGRGNHR